MYLVLMNNFCLADSTLSLDHLVSDQKGVPEEKRVRVGKGLREGM
jgi:hypothetical protein